MKEETLDSEEDRVRFTSDDSKSDLKESSSRSTCLAALLLFAISFARIGSGLFLSIHGPTLLTLANNVGSDVSDVSWLFSGRSLGLLVGGIVTGPIMRKTDKLLGFGLTSLLLSCVVIATPWIEDLWLLVIVVMIGGASYGYLDAGMQALILQLWGEKRSRGLISGYHFMIAVGAFLAPILAGPFLSEQDNSDTCPNRNAKKQNFTANITSMTVTDTYAITKPDNSTEINPVVWAYLICGCILAAVCLVFLLLSCYHLEPKMRKTRRKIIEDRKEESVKGLIILFALLCLYYFFCVGGDSLYNSYIYSISICSDLQFSSSDGTLINSLFWTGLGIGRLCGVVFLHYITPRTVITFDLAGIIISMVVMSIFGESTASVAWAVTFFYGFFQATIYPAGVSWTSQYTNMSGNYIFIFSVGQALGTMTLVPVGGILFDIDPFNVMYIVLGCSVCNAITFGLIILESRKLKKRTGATNENCIKQDCNTNIEL